MALPRAAARQKRSHLSRAVVIKVLAQGALGGSRRANHVPSDLVACTNSFIALAPIGTRTV